MTNDDRKTWTMPAWMEPYRDLINNTGGNPIEELVNDTGTDAQSNLIRAALIVCTTSQVQLLEALHQRGLLPADLGKTREGEVFATLEPKPEGPWSGDAPWRP